MQNTEEREHRGAGDLFLEDCIQLSDVKSKFLFKVNSNWALFLSHISSGSHWQIILVEEKADLGKESFFKESFISKYQNILLF